MIPKKVVTQNRNTFHRGAAMNVKFTKILRVTLGHFAAV
jgi:hypothetical protein